MIKVMADDDYDDEYDDEYEYDDDDSDDDDDDDDDDDYIYDDIDMIVISHIYHMFLSIYRIN